jgi:ribosomal protein S18 acetylase RimI-like enzyme
MPGGGVSAGPSPAPAGVTVRPFGYADVEAGRWLIYRAYAEALLRLYGPGAVQHYEVRSPHFMELYLARDPAGCLAAEAPDGTLVGVVFCFAWGQAGWFGSLAVAPEWQGRGVGQLLAASAVEYLASRGCTRLGLETWPDDPLVRHLYRKLGFRPARLTIKLSRSLEAGDDDNDDNEDNEDNAQMGVAPRRRRRDVRPPRPPRAGDDAPEVARPGADAPLPPWGVQWLTARSAGDVERAVDDVQDVAQALYEADPGQALIDYRTEVRATVGAGWAEVAVLPEPGGRAAAVALANVRRPSGARAGALDLRLLLVRPTPHDEAALDAVLRACRQRAAALGMPAMTCDVNLRYARAARLLRRQGFRPVFRLIRMERPRPGVDLLGRSPLIECVRWAG